MDINIQQIPDISQYNEYIYTLQLTAEVSIVLIFKQMFRSDEVLLDIYLNEIADDTKIVSGKILQPDSIICLPRHDLSFEYQIECVNQDCVEEPLDKNNAYKFYLYFRKLNDTETDE